MRSHLSIAFAAIVFMQTVKPCIAAESAIRTSDADYRSDNKHALHFCIPLEDGSAKHPAALLIHGGGWSGGQPASLNGRCMDFAARGIIGVTVQYKLASKDDPSSRWPAQLTDVQQAFDWLQKKASDYKIDPRRICVYGESAGGHLALWLGAMEKRISCVVDAFGPSDLTKLGRQYLPGFSILFGVDPNEAILKKASPLYGDVASFPPTMLIQGENDKLVPPEQTVMMQNALRESKIPNIALFYSGDHSWLDLPSNHLAAIRHMILDFVANSPPR
jgi:acetyl esterase/lipase